MQYDKTVRTRLATSTGRIRSANSTSFAVRRKATHTPHWSAGRTSVEKDKTDGKTEPRDLTTYFHLDFVREMPHDLFDPSKL